MQILTNFPSLIDRSLRFRFQTIIVVCFLVWTPLLVIQTFQVQHSCHPMIHWSGTLSDECQPNSKLSKKPETQRDRSQEQKQIPQRDDTPLLKPSPTPQPPRDDEPQPPEKRNLIEEGIKMAKERNLIEEGIKIAKEHPDITGGFIGIGVGITLGVTAVATAPLAVAVGIGAAVWFLTRTGLSNIS